MKTTLKTSGSPRQVAADLVVVAVPTKEPRIDGALADLDEALGGVIAAIVARGEVDGTSGSHALVHVPGTAEMKATHVGLVGVGDASADHLRAAGAAGARIAAGVRAGSVTLATGGLSADAVQTVIQGFGYAEYRFDRFRTGEAAAKPRVARLTVLSGEAKAAHVQRADRLVSAVSAARDLVNTPSNHLTPTDLAARAETLGATTAGLEVKVLGRAELKKLKAGALLAVAQGSEEPPRMIVMRYSPKRRARGTDVLGLVGKAVTFDTGGISIKPANGMEEMKMDMGGGAAVIESMALIAQMGLPIEVVAVVPSTENMPSGTAVKPGDVVTAMNGKTIEVINTDAEGRLILADALTYAVRTQKVDRIVDFATLTGAILVALGETYAGLYGSDAAWTERVRAAGEAAGDLCWELPLHPDYQSLIESKVADLSNASNKRLAGATYAAQFLREFTDGVPWCHVDIAGTGMIGGAGTGFGVGLVRELVEGLAG